ncbi:MAG: BamA/TamA family outer membrane protein, partial [Bacteroidota bacterium]
DYSVDQKAFAKARLFDMFIGDWGRHADQWRWASFKEDDKTVYKPIPRDRDQAYTIFDGFYPFIATHIAGGTHLESFDYKIHHVDDFNLPGRPLDRQFTNQLTEKQWVSVAAELQQALTDPVIEYGIHLLPSQIFAINGEKIIAKLKSRRDHLQEYAKSYYKFLAKRPYIPGSDKNELFEIDRISNNETKINVYKIKKNKQEKELLFSRSFYSNESTEIFLYGFKGKDVFDLKGNSNGGIKIRVIGVTDADTVISKNSSLNSKTKVYKGKDGEFDTTYQARLHVSPIIFIVPSSHSVFKKDPLELFTRTGLRIGANLDYHIQPWKKEELEYRQMLSLNYGVASKAFNIEYLGLFPRVAGKWDFIMKARYDMPAVENFFGIGNETKLRNKETYYNSESIRLYGSIGLSRNFAKFQHAELSGFYQQVNINETPGIFITELNGANFDLSANQFAGIESGYGFRKTNDDKFPTKGFDFSLGMGYVFDLMQPDLSYYKINSSLAFYIPVGKSFSFAVRAGGGTISGNADYYHLNKLGGNLNLRGFYSDRFYGKTSFYNNNELRWLTNTHNYLFNGKIGLLAFVDNGHIWQPLEDSRSWHTGYGGGLILIPFNKVVLTGTYGLSNEGNHTLLKAGLFF